MPDRLADTLGPLAGLRILGGCGDCDAYQTVAPNPDLDAVWHMTVHHDDDCPTYRGMAA